MGEHRKGKQYTEFVPDLKPVAGMAGKDSSRISIWDPNALAMALKPLVKLGSSLDGTPIWGGPALARAYEERLLHALQNRADPPMTLDKLQALLDPVVFEQLFKANQIKRYQ